MSTGREILEGEGEGESVGLLREETSGAGGDDNGNEGVAETYDPKESALETAERLLGDIEPEPDALPGREGEKAKDPEAEDSTKLEAKADRQRGKDGKFQKAEAKDPLDEDLDPLLNVPARANAQQAKLFNNLPKGLKRAVNQWISDSESGAGRVVQQANEVIREWAPLREAITPFAHKWAEMGVGVVPGILQLAAVQSRLTDPNEQTREAEYLKLAKRSKVDIVKLARRILGQEGGDASGIPDLSQHPVMEQILPLRSELDALKSQLETQRIEREAAPLLAKMEAVRNEVDQATGRWKYPLLQNETTLNSVKTLVRELVRDTPGLSYPDALRKAHDIRMREIFGESFQASPARPPAPRETNTHRAPSVGFSVRGRPAPTASALEPEMPEHARRDAKSSLEWFLRG